MKFLLFFLVIREVAMLESRGRGDEVESPGKPSIRRPSDPDGQSLSSKWEPLQSEREKRA
ncbi:MAG TPA: hypothetical protein DDZ83_18735 [Nitrospinae bacterium]|nr:hypothetical protein [Nitrospinota bacterium]